MRTEIRCTRPDNWMPLRRLGIRRLTRAHLLLDRRPALTASAREGVARVAAALSQELGCELSLEAARVETVTFPSRELGALSAFGVFELAAGVRAVLDLELSSAVALVERLCGARASTGPVLELTRLEEGALGYLLLVALAALRADPAFDRLWAPRLIAVQGDRGMVAREVGSAPHVAFDLTFGEGEKRRKARLYVPADALVLAAEGLPAPAPRPIPAPVAQAELPVTCRVGHCELDAETLGALVPGDVVLLGGGRFEEGQLLGPARLFARTFELEGTFSPDGFHLTRGHRRLPPKEPSMSEDAPSQLPVELEVELTRVSLAISELSALEPGSVLPLHMSVTKPVLLRVGDRVVAKAELVDVEGEIGARIVSLVP